MGFFEAIQDLIKYKIIQFINTGDKTYDSLLVTLCLTIMSIVLVKPNWQKIYYFIFPPREITADNHDYLLEQYKKDRNSYQSISWIYRENREFMKKFLFYLRKLPLKNNSKCPYMNMKTLEEIRQLPGNILDKITDIANNPCVVYVERKKMIVLRNNTDLILDFNDHEFMKKFVNKINSIQVEEQENSEEEKKETKENTPSIYIIMIIQIANIPSIRIELWIKLLLGTNQ